MISTNPSDHHEFINQFEHYEKNYMEKIPKRTTLVADNGYYTEESLKVIKPAWMGCIHPK